MPLRLPRQVFQRAFSNSSQSRTAIAPHHYTYNAAMASATSTVPKLGRIGRWYLPTMALIALSMTYASTKHLFLNPLASSATPSRTSSRTLDQANRQIGFAIANALNEASSPSSSSFFSSSRSKTTELSQHEKNRLLLDAYGARSTLEDMQHALDMMTAELEGAQGSGAGSERGAKIDQRERNRRLEEAYGQKASLRDLERAMEVYEVQ
ncbi:hypothetical protein K491DRAFT_691224 [Lophiostoma macrostomum CBS 122681]|uniref:Uncharacterized protein n=1 Tax=Lophiostoma macrostomum CBS 122681 TaxID=1314788 RepID=A0A6A6TD40_9PLEO|nr:hypothetical protein K491DRAFT_691224 [Lophiostoma macrostomum CBS 122681]